MAVPRLANSGAWLSCSVAAVCAAMVTATFSCGVSAALSGAALVGGVGLSGASTSTLGDSVTASPRVSALPDRSQADAAFRLRHRKLERLAFLQGNFGADVDRERGNGDPHQIGLQHF